MFGVFQVDGKIFCRKVCSKGRVKPTAKRSSNWAHQSGFEQSRSGESGHMDTRQGSRLGFTSSLKPLISGPNQPRIWCNFEEVNLYIQDHHSCMTAQLFTPLFFQNELFCRISTFPVDFSLSLFHFFNLHLWSLSRDVSHLVPGGCLENPFFWEREKG